MITETNTQHCCFGDGHEVFGNLFDWADDNTSRRSISCNMIRVDRFLLEGNVHGQTNIADSSGVAELYAINSGCKDGLGVIEESVEFKTKIEYGSPCLEHVHSDWPTRWFPSRWFSRTGDGEHEIAMSEDSDGSEWDVTYYGDHSDD